jgi:hypothetical protein
MRRPRTSSISSSFEVRKITGIEVFCRMRCRRSIPSIRGIFMSRTAMSGIRRLNASNADWPSL